MATTLDFITEKPSPQVKRLAAGLYVDNASLLAFESLKEGMAGNLSVAKLAHKPSAGGP